MIKHYPKNANIAYLHSLLGMMAKWYVKSVELLKQVTIENAAEADRIFSMLMGEDVGPRREFIEKNATFANIDA